MSHSEFLGNLDIKTIEKLYLDFKKDPESIQPQWKDFFAGFELALSHFNETDALSEQTAATMRSEFNVIDLINAYRERGHLFTKTNPVRSRRKYFPGLEHPNFGLSDSALDKDFQAGEEIGIGRAPLKKIIDQLELTYCQSIGVEYMYIRTPEIVQWLKHRMESTRNQPSYNPDQKKQILKKLMEAVGFEHFLRKRFPGQKRFSLEGGESLIPALDAVIESGSRLGASEYVIGMAHRGRLNVLANILRKPYHKIFSEFRSHEYAESSLLGDVKYHLGCTLETSTRNGHPVNISIAPNPSHLEAVNPVVEGLARAKAEHKHEKDLTKVVPILIHGDASISGQGIVYEVLQMSQLPAYKTGGTVHLVINNQLGFTTNYLDGRSSTYCTDVAKTIQSPIFHVNGDDVEAVVYALELAMEFRQKFGRDVFIDLLSYRKYGHNESDEPRFTQPILYKIIEKHPDPASLYIEKLVKESIVTTREAENIRLDFEKHLDEELKRAEKIEKGSIDPFLANTWKNHPRGKEDNYFAPVSTAISTGELCQLAGRITELPDEKRFFRKTIRLMQERRKMVSETGLIDWSTAESLAFASLLNEGYGVRFTGQDVERGTFSQRHAVLKMEASEEEYIPLKHLGDHQGHFQIYNSLLSEYGVLGFEYGYAMGSPDSLVLWEAQFGDFVNGAQIIIDQFLASAEEKWRVMNGLVMLLPHGFEGQGPEHSSGRMERFLSQCADFNMQVVNPSTPANYYHVLRRQLKRSFRKPLVIFTPKSLLRHPQCISKLKEFSKGHFHEIIDDIKADAEQTERVILCSGKIYYELAEEQQQKGFLNTAIIRLEQLYPVKVSELEALRQKYSKARRWIWVQEEPQNMGAWPFLKAFLPDMPLSVIARPPSGSPASGSSQFHQMQQRKIIEKAFQECDCRNVCHECQQLCISHLRDAVQSVPV